MAENLWALRELKKLSVAALAGRAGLSIGLIMEYESGQRAIDARHLARLARALYVEESEIRLQSEPRPGAGQLERQPRRDERTALVAHPPQRAQPPTPPHGTAAPMLPDPARPTQISHLRDILAHLNRTEAEVEPQLGKPLAELSRAEARALLTQLQAELRAARPPDPHRAYLPEAVDRFELRYLQAAQAANAVLHFVLFDSTTLTGQLVGFSPYSITVREPGGVETTLNKLAVVRYSRLPDAAATGEEPAA